MDKVSTALFRTPVSKVEASNLGGACSGFICKNSKGEMLQGRNYDGDYGEMVVVSNRNVKPGEHKSVMMTDPNVVQALAGLAYDFVALAKDINLHWCVSDGNKWLTLEYWRDETGDDVLYVFDENDRVQSARIGCRYVAYEYLSMENYYYNPIPSATWQKDFWQHEYGVPVRVHNLMGIIRLLWMRRKHCKPFSMAITVSAFPDKLQTGLASITPNNARFSSM